MSFPSVSCTIPNVVNLDNDDVSLCISTTLDESSIKDKSSADNNTKSEDKFNLFKHQVMSNSSIIEYEATKLAKALENNDSMQYSMLDQVKPPSPMGSLLSLSQSICSNIELDFEQNNTNTYKVMRNPLPGALLVRRALNSYFTSSSDSFDHNLNNSLYNIDSVKPPSVMNDLDMDNSINSVASITSEIADIKFSNSPPLQNSFLMNSVNDIEDINPPSLLGELTLNDNSLSEMSLSEPKDVTITLDKSPRKSLTPKQNRQLSKERYLTYTLQQELIDNIKTGDDDTSNESLMSPSKLRLKKTCKQRRQEDRARFQTQVLDVSECESKSSTDTNTYVKKSGKEKRYSDGERFKTRNLNAVEGNQFNFNIEDVLEYDADLVVGLINDKANKTFDANPINSTINESDKESGPPTFIAEENNKELNKTIDIAPYDQSRSYTISHAEEDEDDNNLHTGPEIVIPTQKIIDEPVSKVVRPRHNKSSYISPYRNMSSRQISKNSINKPKIIANKQQVDSKAVINSMLTMKPTLSRFTKTIQQKSDNRKKSPAANLANKTNMNSTAVKPMERQGTFTKDEQISQTTETNENRKIPVATKRVSAIPCKLPKSIELKSLQPSNLKKPTVKSSLQKIATTETVNNKPKIPVKSGIPSKLMSPSNIKPSNLKPPSKLSFIYKKSEDAKKLTKGESDSGDRKRIQRSQTFDNRASDKCVLAHANKQKSSIGIRPPQRYGKI